MKLLNTILLLFFLFGWVTPNKLLLVLLDGFRWDYFNNGLKLPAFASIFRRGVKAQRMVPAYPPVSYPNHYTLLTGLYTESHGFVGNEMYDVTTGKLYAPWYTNLTAEERGFMYNGAEPLWISAVKQNKRVYMFHWVGCEVTIRGRQPTFCRKNTGVPSPSDFSRALNESVELFRNGSCDLSVVYHQRTDDFGHRYGPMSEQVNSTILEVDKQLGRLMTKLSETGLDDDVDVMIFSDHGMTSVSTSRVANVSGVLPSSNVDIVVNGYGSHVYVWPKEGKEELVYSQLVNDNAHMKVYLKEEIPASWHFQNNARIPPLLLVANLTWYIDTPNFGFYTYDTGPMKGEHGYDPASIEMSGIFTAFGPHFVSGSTVDVLQNVDLYQIMCRILNIQPLPHNGTWSRVSHVIQVSSCGGLHALNVLMLTAFLAALIALF